MLEMAKKEIIPAVCSYMKELSDTVIAKKALSSEIDCELEKGIVSKLASLSGSLYERTKQLEESILGLKTQDPLQKQGEYYRDVVIPAMQALRTVADEIETLVGEKYWPYPTYGQLLFSV